jgi:hypothetical protein
VSTTPVDLRAIAGCSLSAPYAEYEVNELSFGSTTVRRDTTMPNQWGTITLFFDAETVARCASAGGASIASLVVPITPGVVDEEAEETTPTFDGMRALIVEHKLFSHPELLRQDEIENIPSHSPAGERLAALNAQLRQMVDEASFGRSTRCTACRQLDPRSIPTRRPGLYTDVYSENPYLRPPPCPHQPLLVEALKAVCDMSPELTFEWVGLLVPSFTLTPPRFVLAPAIASGTIANWLTGRAQSSYLGWYGAEWRPKAHSKTSRSHRKLREAGLEGMSPTQRNAMVFAAEAWEAEDVTTALETTDHSTATTDLLVQALERDETFEMVAVLPPSIQPVEKERVASKRHPAATGRSPAAKAAKAAKAATTEPTITEPAITEPAITEPAITEPAITEPAVSETTTAVTTTAVTTTAVTTTAVTTTTETTTTETTRPEGELMTSQLRDLGYSDAAIKKLLKSGELERTGFGWFRFVRPPWM